MWVLRFLLNVALILISSFHDYKVSYHNHASATIYRRRCQMNVAANRKRKIMSRLRVVHESCAIRKQDYVGSLVLVKRHPYHLQR